MPSIIERYRSLDYQLPKTYLSWDLFGAGLENLGRDSKAVTLPLRDPNPDELLLRVDALGLCFSDTKLILAGPKHPRITGRDLVNNPTVAGHEAALTVAKVGSNWKNKFSLGQRFIIQADIKVDGVQKAFGYVQRGAMAQYTYVDQNVLSVDNVCYLLPLKDTTGYIEAALVEPWACVEGAYGIVERTAPVSGGRALVVFASPDAKADFSGVYTTPPKSLTVLGHHGQDLSTFGVKPNASQPSATAAAVKAAAEANAGFNDIFLVGNASAELIEACDLALAESGILCFLSDGPLSSKAKLDIGRVHYLLTRFVGSNQAAARDAYGRNTRSELKAGGRAWMVGAAGPMGQMHVQRALELANPPKKLFCTDLSEERMQYMLNRLQPLATRKGVEFVCLNVGGISDLDQRLKDFTAGQGFDDIYIHAPVAPLAEHAANFLGDNSVLNIFAGVGIGTLANLPPDIFASHHTRLIGSSGSSMEDLRVTLEKVETGQLATRMSLAAIGGIEATWNGIKGLKENRFPGKTGILPQIHGLDLAGMDALAKNYPEVGSKMEAGSIWTTAAELELLERCLKL
ncbi:MAG: alcohol dehydrogenase catalytic domain-containing protein [Planctomycetota bacterium]|jgi:threonine dehydrogenase-like Zn-dependent dehydrogenase|nr:alcohol dehydrogenase catalytic domain-containing protein [Planctomycetota bacterium]